MPDPSHPFGSIQRPVLIRDEVYDHLRQAIIRGQLSSQHWLSERELADILEVSRTPIREAVKQLVQEGLLVTSSRGIKVREYSVQEAIDIYEVRELLECRAARLAAVRHTPQQLEQLMQQMQLMQQILVGDFANHIKLDLAFHALIAECGGNDALQEMIKRLTSKLIGLRVVTREEILSLPSLGQHEQIVSAIAAGNEDAAEQAMRDHILFFKTLLGKRLQVADDML